MCYRTSKRRAVLGASRFFFNHISSRRCATHQRDGSDRGSSSMGPPILNTTHAEAALKSCDDFVVREDNPAANHLVSSIGGPLFSRCCRADLFAGKQRDQSVKEFNTLPEGARFMTGYITTGTLQVLRISPRIATAPPVRCAS